MGDKFDGALAGGGRSSAAEVAVTDALQDLALNETLVAADESGNITLLRAVQNPYHGGVMVTAQQGDMNCFAMMEAIKLSQMTSMLNDNDRCTKYAKAISKALQRLPGARVLDIGTGTGLLAMLAARAGAQHVDAVEMFQPMAEVASGVITDNHLENKISVHAAKSTELFVRSEGDVEVKEHSLAEKSDILVTEIFDSVLLGEACVPVIAHARRELLRKNAIVVPSKAVLYGIVLNSEFFLRFQNLGNEFPLHRSNTSPLCRGGSRGIPMHFEALEEGKDYERLSEKFEVFRFDFAADDLNEYLEHRREDAIQRIKQGIPTAILTWWELDLTGDGDIIYSTKPGVENWQDHWLPVVYPLSTTGMPCPIDESIPLSMGHDQLSFWFTYGTGKSSPSVCLCGYHALPGGPYRIFELGDDKRMTSLRSRISKAMEVGCAATASADDHTNAVRCIDISESSVCAVLASKTGAHMKMEIISMEEDNELSTFLYSQVTKRGHTTNKGHEIHIEYNPLSTLLEREERRKREDGDWHGFDVIMSEPYTRAMSAYPLSTLGNLIVQRLALSDLVSPRCVTVPRVARVKAQALYFPAETMQRAFGAVDRVQGLDHGSFGALYADWPGGERISLPLFQYRAKAGSAEAVVHEIDLDALEGGKLEEEEKLGLLVEGETMPDVVALWVEYDGQKATRVGRSEVMWVGEEAHRGIGRSGRVWVRSQFRAESGTFDVNLTGVES